MRVSSTKAHPEAKGRTTTVKYKITSTGSAGDYPLPENTELVSIMAQAEDGVDKSTSSRVFVEFTLDDDPGQLDSLIGRLADLRAAQRKRKGV